MGAPPGSQVVPLPSNLPFRLVSKTIGEGAYASSHSIRKAVPHNRSNPVIAIKFINKKHALQVGRLSPKQLQLEISLHWEVTKEKGHPNVIKLLTHGADVNWHWIALELAEGGDLFDKIEADEGVPEEVAHFYFRQLVSAVSWCHAKGVAHRDIKPENMLLSGDGDLKLADFGLAANFMDIRNGRMKKCSTVCGSPPYIAPEILRTGKINEKRRLAGESKEKGVGYMADVTDLWSCAIVLFVLLVGNTPWDSPVEEESAEYEEYLATNGRPNDELWDNIPPEAISLIRGMLRVEPSERFTIPQITTHPWYLMPNKYMNDRGTASNSVALATTMMERLHIDLSQSTPMRSQATQTAVPRDSQAWTSDYPATQPETPSLDQPFDWEPSVGSNTAAAIFASQPTTARDATAAAHLNHTAAAAAATAAHLLHADVSLSQFSASQTPTALPLTLTQAARRFGDIAPSSALTRFYSSASPGSVLEAVGAALVALGVQGVERARAGDEDQSGGEGGGQQSANRRRCLYLKTLDGRRQLLVGNVLLDPLGPATGLTEVRFVKAQGDPLEWRRLFKRVVAGVRHLVLVPQETIGWSQVV